MKKIYAAPFLLIGVLTLTACGKTNATLPGTIQISNSESQVISVESSEKVKVVPDIAEVIFSVYTQTDTPESCASQNNESLQQALTVLKEAGIAETSIQTSGYGMNPLYDWNSGKTITGYEMTTNITISDLPLEQLGGVLSACVDAGINNITTVTYLSSGYDEAYQEALKKAMESAKVKAAAIAEAGGRKIGNVVHIEEYQSDQQARYTDYGTGANKAAAADMAMSVMPGQLDVVAAISVEFELVSQ